MAVATVQSEVGLVSKKQLQDLIKHQNHLSVERIDYWELDPANGTKHDIAAAIKEYSENAPIGGEILHQGLTSEDILSNAEIILIRQSFLQIRAQLVEILEGFANFVERHKSLVCMGYTHLQAAEPTTVGYRFAKYAQDLLIDLNRLDSVMTIVKGKGIKGAVGTSASIEKILKGSKMTIEEHERKVMQRLGLEYVLVSDQTYPRKFLYETESVLSGIGGSLHRFALDLQILQSSFVDEISEPRKGGQVGSSAMPHKQNPISSESIDSLTQILPGELFSAWMSASFVTLERTLRDSAGKRDWLPESFLIVDEALVRTKKLITGLIVHEASVKNNLDKFGPFVASEIILARLVSVGMDRKLAHEKLVAIFEKAVEKRRRGEVFSIPEMVLGDGELVKLLGQKVIQEAFEEVYVHVGNAPKRSMELVKVIRKAIKNDRAYIKR